MNNIKDPFEINSTPDSKEAEQNSNNNSDNVKLLKELLVKVENKEHLKWEFIVSIFDWFDKLQLKKAIKHLLKGFNKAIRASVKAQCHNIKNSIPSFEITYTIKQFLDIVNFYEEELKILDDMFDEFRQYVLKGHILDTILGNIRQEEDLYDYRK